MLRSLDTVFSFYGLSVANILFAWGFVCKPSLQSGFSGFLLKDIPEGVVVGISASAEDGLIETLQ